MKTIRVACVALLALGSALTLTAASAQQAGSKRTDLQRHDLTVPGREVIQVRVDFDPGICLPDAHTPRRRDHLRPRGHVGV